MENTTIEALISIAIQLTDQMLQIIFPEEMKQIMDNDSEKEDDEDDEMMHIMAAESIDDQHIRIIDYVERVIPNYTRKEFQQHFRLTIPAFECLQRSVSQSQSLENFASVQIRKQLLAFVWLLANQESFRSVADRFNYSKGGLNKIFFRHVAVINEISNQFIKWPDRTHMNASINEFKKNNKIRGVIGAIDGTYVAIKAPRQQQYAYTNRKFYTSMTLQAISDHKLRFIDTFAGYPSSSHDAKVFKESPIYEAIIANPAGFFPNGEKILGDAAYPLNSWLLVPYKNRGRLNEVHRYFNYKLSSARQVVERSFALLFGRFRRLKRLDMNILEAIPATINAACVLHNICLLFDDEQTNYYVADGQQFMNNNSIEVENELCDENFRSTENAIHLRDNIARDLFLHRS